MNLPIKLHLLCIFQEVKLISSTKKFLNTFCDLRSKSITQCYFVCNLPMLDLGGSDHYSTETLQMQRQ